MQTLKVPNQTTKKDPNYIGNLGQSEQEMLLRSVWCARKDLNLHTLRHMLLRHACLPFHHSR